MENLKERILSRLAAMEGSIGFCYKNLVTGETMEYNPALGLRPASVMKLYVLTEAFRRFEDGTLDPDEFVTIPRRECYPSCGAITYLHDNFTLTVHDLCVLMIIVSDNSATNFLIKIMGLESINRTIRAMGLNGSAVNRRLWDAEAESRGIQNVSTAGDTARWLEMLWNGEVVSKKASREMLDILKNQRLNGKIPFYIHALENARPIAHKTGEETRTTHDVGIVLADRPFIVSFMGNDTDVPAYERLMAEVSLELFNANMDAQR